MYFTYLQKSQFCQNVTTLLHWADDMKCLINSVKNSSSKKKKKKKNPYRPTLFLFSPLRQYNNFLFLALHTTLYGSAAGCRSIQKTCALWKHGLTSKNIQSHLTYFCKSNIIQIFNNGGGMIWGVRIAIFTEIRHLVEELITFLSIFGPQKLGILTARLNKSLSISTSIQWEGISVFWSCPKPPQLLREQQLLNNSVIGHARPTRLAE